MGVRQGLWVVVMAHIVGCGSKWDFQDVDGDGISAAEGDCWDSEEGPAGTGLSGGDISPDATETWYDGFDQNCSGDDDYDADADGFVPEEYLGLETRGQPESGLLPGGDCWDESDGPDTVEYGGAEIRPDATDVWYDGVDQDCGGNDDFDADEDGFVGDSFAGVLTIGAESIGALPGGDCWDDPSSVPAAMMVATGQRSNGQNVDWGQPAAHQVNPDAGDAWYDGVDQNCDGSDDFDQDADGFKTMHYPDQSGAFAGADCVDRATELEDFVGADLYDLISGDAYADVVDLAPESINPGVEDTWYDGVDQDCGYNDDCDADADEYATEIALINDCVSDPGQACCAIGELVDCDDDDPERYPDPEKEEIYFNGIDDNCDLADGDGDWDGDGFWVIDYQLLVEDAEGGPPDGYEDDCHDGDSTIHPTAPDVPYDAIDQDCSGGDDFDADGDGFHCGPEVCAYAGGVVEYGPTYPWDGTLYTGDVPMEEWVDDPWLEWETETGETRPTVMSTGVLPGGDCEDDPLYTFDPEDADLSGVSGASINPVAAERWYDGLDQDCDGRDDFDQDEDGYRCKKGEDWCDYPLYTETYPWTAAMGLDHLYATGDALAGDCEDDPDVSVIGFDADEINPGVDDTWYDGLDQDCDERDDYDQDEDGYYAEAEDYGATTYADGTGALDGGDCQDDPDYSLVGFAGADINPGAAEVWYDGLDSDCDADDDYDADGDGWVPTGYGASSFVRGEETLDGSDVSRMGDNDCEDDPTYTHSSGIAAADTNPGESDTWYDGLDQDCDGRDDYDQDEDHFVRTVDVGSATHPVGGTGELPGNDCDDTNAAVYDGAPDAWYDGVDNDCAGNDDYDQDDDGFYAEAVSGYGATTYASGTGSLSGGDCEDDPAARVVGYSGAEINPGASEEWYDGLDQDCDDKDDYDQDEDGFYKEGESYAATTYAAGTGGLSGGDCQDNPSYSFSGGISGDDIYPGASDAWYDGLDQDCASDDDFDADLDRYIPDGYGSATIVRGDATLSGGDVGRLGDGDCDESDITIHPNADETCNDDVDSDCDETENDEDAALCDWYNIDEDGDGYGRQSAPDYRCFCSEFGGYDVWNVDGDSPDVINDCDDDAFAVNPGATEVCDDIDNDCNEGIDEDSAEDALTWYDDGDSDSFGDASDSTEACEVPSGHVSNSRDCNDASSVTYPGAAESDSPADACMKDGDFDGYGDDSPPGGVTAGDDCNDGNGAIHPAATEVCDGANTDEDCDGDADDDDTFASGKVTRYHDFDEDTYGDGTDSDTFCDVPSDHVSNSTDCNDADAAVNPGATEVCDGIDNDCDPATEESSSADADFWYADDDGDGFGELSEMVRACDQPVDYVDNSDDCDDDGIEAGATYPGAAFAESAFDCMLDFDGDGYGEIDVDSGVVSGTDCDDVEASVNPAEDENTDGAGVGRDDDCDEYIDENEIYDLLDDDPDADVVVITEVQINPFAPTGQEVKYEWFEITNVSAITVYLDGWHFMRERHTSATNLAGFAVTPGQALTMAPGERLLMCAKNPHGDLGSACDYYYAQSGAYGTPSRCEDVGDSGGDVVDTTFKLTNIAIGSEPGDSSYKPFYLRLGLYDDDCLKGSANFITLDEIDSGELLQDVEGAAIQVSVDIVTGSAANIDNDDGDNWCMNDLDIYGASPYDNAGTPGAENLDCGDLIIDTAGP